MSNVKEQKEIVDKYYKWHIEKKKKKTKNWIEVENGSNNSIRSKMYDCQTVFFDLQTEKKVFKQKEVLNLAEKM